MTKTKYFDEHEVRAFFSVLKRAGSARDELFFRFTFHYGLRVSEACEIRLGDVKPDLKNPVEIEIHRKKQGTGRHYSLSYDDKRVLQRWLKVRKGFPNAETNEFVFVTSRSGDGPMTSINAQMMHRKYATLADIAPDKRGNIHAWRHSCAIHLLLSGKDVNFVKQYLGHRSLASTLVYSEFAPAHWNRLTAQAVENFVV